MVLEPKFKTIGSLTFLMILNFHQKHWSMTPHIHVQKIIYKIIYTFSVVNRIWKTKTTPYKSHCYCWSRDVQPLWLLLLSHNSHLDIDCDILIKYRVSSDNSVDLLSGTVILFIVVVSDWCIMNLDHGWWINILLNLLLIYPPIK